MGGGQLKHETKPASDETKPVEGETLKSGAVDAPKLIRDFICALCWQCHQPTRTVPCEHCGCKTPEDKRHEYAEEEALMELVFRHLGNGYLLRVPHDAVSELPSVERGPYPCPYAQTVGTVSKRIVGLLKARKEAYHAICKLTKDTENYRVGWRELGLDGDADWYTCLI